MGTHAARAVSKTDMSLKQCTKVIGVEKCFFCNFLHEIPWEIHALKANSQT